MERYIISTEHLTEDESQLDEAFVILGDCFEVRVYDERLDLTETYTHEKKGNSMVCEWIGGHIMPEWMVAAITEKVREMESEGDYEYEDEYGFYV